MATSTSSVALIGSTGLVGCHILSTILSTGAYNNINTITRRHPQIDASNLHSVIDADTSRWAPTLSSFSPVPGIVFSALGTTKAAAGSIENQWKIDHDLNIELAKAAKEAGTKVFVFISSSRSHGLLSHFIPLFQMKKGVEEAIEGLGFDHGIILRPGLLLGDREQHRAGEGFAQIVVKGLGKVHLGLQDRVGQEAEVIARAAVRAGQMASNGQAPGKHWILEADEIIKLGRA